MIHPSPNRITLPFGVTTGPYSPSSPHKGTDYSYSPDRNVYAPEDGMANTVRWDGKTREGNMVIISVGSHRHALCHLAEFKIQPGPVKKGQVVGIMGDTGYAPGGKHLHWTLRINSVLVDGTKYVNEGDNMTKQEAVAILDAFYGRFAGRKVKQSELDEYIPVFLAGKPDEFYKKAAQFDEVKNFVGTVKPDPDGDKWRRLKKDLEV